MDHIRPLEGGTGGGGGGIVDSASYSLYPPGGGLGDGQGLGPVPGGSSLFESALEDLSQHHFSGSIRAGRMLVNGVRQVARQGYLPGSRQGIDGITPVLPTLPYSTITHPSLPHPSLP